jgi:hypothetical protein
LPTRVGRRQQHQSLGRLRQCTGALQIVLLHMTEISRGEKLKATGQLRCAHAPRPFQQSERTAAGLADDPVADLVVEAARDCPRQEGARILLVKPS